MIGTPAPQDADRSKSVRYPTDSVVGVLDTADHVAAAVTELTSGGFLDSEIQVQCGVDSANTLDVNTGRRGLAHLAIRIAEQLGLENIEMERKERYEQAMRDGLFVIVIATPTEERRDRASAILANHEAHTVSSFGRFIIHDIVPPKHV